MTDSWRKPNEELAQRLAASRQHWLSEGREGAPLVAPGADLRDMDLTEQTLAEARLQGADLRGARLDSAILVRAALDGARLDGARLFNADASRASFQDATLNGVEAPRSYWMRAALIAAQLRNANLADAVLIRTELLGADLTGAVLRNADMRGAILSSAVLAGADFAGVDLDGALVREQSLAGSLNAEFAAGVPVLEVDPSQGAAVDFRAGPAFEHLVREHLQTVHGAEVHHVGSLPGQPDFVVVLPGDRYVAVEAKTRLPIPPDAFERWRADVVVVPDTSLPTGVRNLPVVPLSEAPPWIATHADEISPVRGAMALSLRQLARLRPWLLLAARHREDPSALSRLSVWVDTGRQQPFLLTSKDRYVSERIPAHVDGETLARGVRWAASSYDGLSEFADAVRALWKSSHPDAQAATELVRQGQKAEQELSGVLFGGRNEMKADDPL
jgi:hypothetical protein